MSTDTHIATGHGPVARPRNWIVTASDGTALTEALTHPQASREWDRRTAQGETVRITNPK